MFPHNFSSGDYLSGYDAGDNFVFGLIYTTPDSADTIDAYMKYYGVVDTIENYMLDKMESKNNRICDDSDSIRGEEH